MFGLDRSHLSICPLRFVLFPCSYTHVWVPDAALDVLRAGEIIPTPPAPLGNANPVSLDGRAVSSTPPPANVKREREEGSDLSDRSGFSDEEEARMYARLKVCLCVSLAF
jgi:hypothetical protein